MLILEYKNMYLNTHYSIHVHLSTTKNLCGITKKHEKAPFEETKKSSEAYSDMTWLLELSEREFKTTMTNMLKQ